jgi:LmbE family N-acetylglucosaminyl deacetylase
MRACGRPFVGAKTFDVSRESIAVLVAHPDDETLWAGGTLLEQSTWSAFVVSACRGSDADRAPKFFAVLGELGAEGKMADLDDGPEQQPLPDALLEQTLLDALPARQFDRILTHSPLGEYTRHRRHEEVGRAVLRLWLSERLRAPEVWLFAYEDGGRAHLPRARGDASVVRELTDDVWQHKRRLITERYGFGRESWEARVTPQREAFHRLSSHAEAEAWLTRKPEP